MKFFEQREDIPEWRGMYFQKEHVYKLLALFQKFPPKIESNHFKFFISAHNHFWETIEVECEKIKVFNDYILARISHELSFIKNIIPQVHRILDHDHLLSGYKKVRKGLLSIYHEAKLAILFTKTNSRRIHLALKSYNQYSQKIFHMNYKDRIYLAEKKAAKISDSNFTKIIVLAEEMFINLPNHGNSKQDLSNDEREHYISSSSTKNQKYSSYIIFWIILMVILLIFFVFYSEIFNIYPKDKFFKEVFPIYRGIFLLNIYFWILISNSLVWSIYDINYDTILGFKSKSELSKLIMKVTFFTLISIGSFIAYNIGTSVNQDYKLKSVYAAIPWLILLLYLFFPSKKIFNWEGRKYFFKFWSLMILFWRKPPPFKLIWFSDQLNSLVMTIRDIEYSLCYFFSLPNGIEGECKTTDRFSNTLFIPTFALVARMTQEAKRAYDDGTFKSPSVRNFIKYLLGLITTYISYFSKSNEDLFYLWIAFAFFTTIYSFIWDIYFDFGIEKIIYPITMLNYDKKFYYIVIFINFILRSTWILSFSVFENMILFQTSTAILEIVRRGLWNTLRVEHFHRLNVEKFAVSKEISTDLKYYHISKNLKMESKIVLDNTDHEDSLIPEEMDRNNDLSSNLINESKYEISESKLDNEFVNLEKNEDVTTEIVENKFKLKEEAYKKALEYRTKSKFNLIHGQIYTFER